MRFVFFLLLWLFTETQCAFAEIDSVVLLPIQGNGLESHEKDQFRSASKEALLQRFKNVFSGSEVDEKLQKASKQHCDDDGTRCLTEVSIQFQAYVGRVIVNRDGNHTNYLLTVEVEDIVDRGKSIVNISSACDSCSKGDLINKLRAMLAPQPPSSAQSNLSGAATSLGSVQRLTPTPVEDKENKASILVLNSDPSGADVYLGDVKTGVTPYQHLDLNPAPNQSLRLTLTMPLHHAQTIEVPLSRGKHEVTAKLLPAYGGVEITSSPSAADVFIGGKRVGTTPWRTDRLASGRHSVALLLALHAREDQVLEIKDRQSTTQNFNLTPNFGSLELGGADNDFKVTGTDGAVIQTGTTPFKVNLEPGQYNVELSRTGYEAQSFEVRISSGDTQHIAAEQSTLRRLEGALVIDTEPATPGAKIYLDDQATEKTAPAELRVSAGIHKLKVIAGAQEGTATVEVVDGQTHQTTITLATPAAPATPSHKKARPLVLGGMQVPPLLYATQGLLENRRAGIGGYLVITSILPTALFVDAWVAPTITAGRAWELLTDAGESSTRIAAFGNPNALLARSARNRDADARTSQ